MRAIIKPGVFNGTFRVPSSKSHTIRRIMIASLANGISVIDHPLDSLDTQSCLSVCKTLGAEIELQYDEDSDSPNPFVLGKGKLIRIMIKGLGIGAGGSFHHSEKALDVGNSGTTLFLIMAAAALGTKSFRFIGDSQTAKRSAKDLLEALVGLGVNTVSENGNGCIPAFIQGPIKGGRISLSCSTSQYLSALLLACPLAPRGTITEIDVPLLNEKPYIEMTLSYLDEQNVKYECAEDFSYFKIEGGSVYKPMNGSVPGDFSSAAFPACAAAISGGNVTLLGLDPHDTQGDKKIFDILAQFGCNIKWNKLQNSDWEVSISQTCNMKGFDIDLNDTPDMVPALAATAVFASGKTSLLNVAHARIKETDRLQVMTEELNKLGAQIEEKPDGLIIHGKSEKEHLVLQGGKVKGHGDHRIVMALAIAALGAENPIEIDSAECVDVTYPGFLSLLGSELQD
jgi:3-phosphoshikimate 1-carboxyvinyltransferase